MELAEEKFYTKSFTGLLATNFLYWLGVYIYIPVLPIYFHAAGMSSQQIGMIVGSFSLGAVLFRLIAGKAADHHGTVPVAMAGLILAGSAIVGYWFSTALVTVLLLRFFHGMGSSLYSSAAVTMVTLVNNPKQTKQGVALYTLCSMIGIGIATSMASWFFVEWGFQGVVLISGVATVSGIFFIPKKIERKETQASAPVPVKDILRNPCVYWPTLNQFAVYICYACVMTYLPLMVYDSKPDADMGWFYISYTVVVVSSRFLAGKATKKIAAKHLSSFLLAALLVVILLPIFSREWFSLLVVGVGIGGGVGLATPILIGIITDHIGSANRGVALGFFSTAIDLGMGVGSILLGTIAEPFGYKCVFLVASLWTLLTLIAYSFRGNIKVADKKVKTSIE